MQKEILSFQRMCTTSDYKSQLSCCFITCLYDNSYPNQGVPKQHTLSRDDMKMKFLINVPNQHVPTPKYDFLIRNE